MALRLNMTIRSHIVGSMGGSYYERVDQNGADTPWFLRSQGTYLENPYSMVRISQINPTIEPVFYSKEGAGYEIPANLRRANAWFSIAAGFGTPPSRPKLISDLASQWRNAPVNLGMYFSPEGRESVEMVGSSLERLLHGTRALKRGNWGGFLKEIRPLPPSSKRNGYRKFTQGDLSGAFLSAHLGWSPLISDIYNASNFLSEGARIQSNSIKVKKGYTNPWCFPTDEMYGKKLVNEGCYGVDSIYAKIRRQPTFAERMGLQNPFLVAWELVPLSFVADYFLPIGATIDALAFVGSRVTTNVLRSTYTQIIYSVEIPPGTLSIYANGTFYRNRQSYTFRLSDRKFTRTVEPLSFSECLNWNLSVPTSVLRLSTLAALTHQSILGLKK